MKKLMIASAAVALAGASFAEVTEARVYDVKAIAMTTVAAKNNVSKDYNPFLTAATEGEIVYRQITTKSYSGLIWGCDCDAIAAVTEKEDFNVYKPDGTIAYTTNHWEGSVVWADQPVDGKYNTVWVGPLAGRTGAGKGIWKFINVVEALGNKVEGCWEINPWFAACKRDGTIDPTPRKTGAQLIGSGFGYLEYDANTNRETACEFSTPSYMTGYFAGYVGAPVFSWGENRTICLYCSGGIEFAQCEAATVWDFCRCVPFMDATMTACFGQWTISVNAELSNALLDAVDALDVFPLADEIKKAVKDVRAAE